MKGRDDENKSNQTDIRSLVYRHCNGPGDDYQYRQHERARHRAHANPTAARHACASTIPSTDEHAPTVSSDNCANANLANVHADAADDDDCLFARLGVRCDS